MRKNISNVINAFIANAHCFEKSCSTDGKRIYSYGMVIAEKTNNGIVIRDKGPSKTTTSQINSIKQFLESKNIPFKIKG